MVLDANACLHYCIDITYRSNVKQINICQNPRITKALHSYLSPHVSRKEVAITRIVYDETMKNLWDINADLARKARISSATNVRRMVNVSMGKFFRLLGRPAPLEDDIALMGDVKTMYDDIWNDPSKASKRNDWASHKGVNVSAGPPTGFDLLLLSTAAKLAKKYNVQLLTYDHDFIDFEDEIDDKFDVNVINGYHI